MAEPDFSNVYRQARDDSSTQTLITALKAVLCKYGPYRVMRVVAEVLWRYKRQKFEERLGVKESRTQVYGMIPASLAGVKDVDLYEDYVQEMGMDHPILWQQAGRLKYLTWEPYYISKESLKHLVAHCEKYGIDFQIDAETCYYPGHSIRILFKKGQIYQHDVLQQMNGEYRG